MQVSADAASLCPFGFTTGAHSLACMKNECVQLNIFTSHVAILKCICVC